jgi:hypothetical protein
MDENCEFWIVGPCLELELARQPLQPLLQLSKGPLLSLNKTLIKSPPIVDILHDLAGNLGEVYQSHLVGSINKLVLIAVDS